MGRERVKDLMHRLPLASGSSLDQCAGSEIHGNPQARNLFEVVAYLQESAGLRLTTRATEAVPDVGVPGFAEAAHRQSLAVARSPHAKDDQDFIDAISNRSNK